MYVYSSHELFANIRYSSNPGSSDWIIFKNFYNFIETKTTIFN